MLSEISQSQKDKYRRSPIYSQAPKAVTLTDTQRRMAVARGNEELLSVCIKFQSCKMEEFSRPAIQPCAYINNNVLYTQEFTKVKKKMHRHSRYVQEYICTW